MALFFFARRPDRQFIKNTFKNIFYCLVIPSGTDKDSARRQDAGVRRALKHITEARSR